MQVLHVGGRLFVDDHQIGQQPVRAHVFLHAKSGRDDLQIGDVADAQREDGEIPRDRHWPKRRLAAEPGSDCLGRGTQGGVRIKQATCELLHAGGFGKAEPDMARLHLRTRPGQHRLPAEAVGMQEALHLLFDIGPVCGNDRPERQHHFLTRRHPYPRAQRHHRVEHVARRAGKPRAGIERGGIGNRTASPDEGPPVRLRLDVAGDPDAGRDEMRQRDRRVARRALAPFGENRRTVLAADLRFHEHLGEGGMRCVGRLERQRQLGKGGDVDVAILIAFVPDREATRLAIAFGDDDALHLGSQRADGLGEHRPVVAEESTGGLARHTFRLGRRRPPVAILGIAQEQEGAGPVLGRVGVPARDRNLVGAAVAGARAADHDVVVAVGHEIRRAHAAQRIEDEPRIRTLVQHLRLDPLAGLGADRHCRDLARRLFLQQQLGRLDHGIGVEAIAHAAFEDGIRHCDDGHAVMMRHEVAHHRMALAFRHAHGGEVDRIVIAIASERAEFPEPAEVLDGFRRLELRGKQARIGRDHRVLRQPSLEAEAGDAEIGVLIGHLAVARVIGRFRDAPWHPLGAGVGHLLPDDEVAGLVEDAAQRLLHHQRRHQIFEHRARPRQQRAVEADLGDGAAEAEPVLGRQVALGDAEQAGQPGLGGKQVVAGLVELSFLDAVADGKQLAVLPQQEREIHLECELARAVAQPDQPLAQLADAGFLDMRIREVGFAGLLQLVGPQRQVAALLRADLLVQRLGELADVGRQHGQVDGADRRRLGFVADGVDGTAHALDALGQTLAQRAQRTAVVGQCRQLFLEDCRDVDDAAEIALQVRSGCSRPQLAGGCDGDEVPGEIAAID